MYEILDDPLQLGGGKQKLGNVGMYMYIGRYPIIPCLLSVCFDDAMHGRYHLKFVKVQSWLVPYNYSQAKKTKGMDWRDSAQCVQWIRRDALHIHTLLGIPNKKNMYRTTLNLPTLKYWRFASISKNGSKASLQAPVIQWMFYGCSGVMFIEQCSGLCFNVIKSYFVTSIKHNTRTSNEHPLDDGCYPLGIYNGDMLLGSNFQL